MKALLAALAVAALPASAQPCPSGGMAEGPVALGFFEADVATGRRVCPRSEVGVGGRLGLTVDSPNFYGAIEGDALLFGSLALSERTELFVTLEAMHHQWVQNATIKGSSTAVGQLTAGGSRTIYESGRLSSATSARLMLPTSLSNPAVQVLGVEAGQAASYHRSGHLEMHGYLGADLAAAVSAAGPGLRLGLLVNAGAQWSPWAWFGVVLDLNGHVGGMNSYLAPALGLRFRPSGNLGAELALTLPVAGSDRHDLIAGLRVGYRL